MATLKRAGNALTSQDRTDIKTDLALQNVDNTSDANKPVSTATQTALDGKANTSHTQAASTISDSTAAGRAILTAADAAAQRTALGLGTAATTAATAYATAAQGAKADTAAQIAGDLGGTAASPVVTKVNGVAITGTPTAGQVPVASSGTAAAWGAVPGAGIPDASSLTVTSAEANTGRIPAGALTYTINAATGWNVSDGMAVWLPASGTVSFAVSGGPTINGGTSTLTRTLAGNALGYVVLNRIAGTNAYSLSGA